MPSTVVPPGVETVTGRTPSGAEGAIEKVVVKEVELPTFTRPTVIPVPLTFTTVEPLMKLVPASVTFTLVFGAPDRGRIDASVGRAARTSEILVMKVSQPERAPSRTRDSN